MNTIDCYHGSPGTPEEFSLLEKALPEWKLNRLWRKGYGSAASLAKESSPSAVMGYSWGSFECIQRAAKDPTVSAVILVSPYLFPESKLGLAKKILIQTPFLGDLLLNKAAPGVILEFLQRTSHPAPIPEAYRKASDQVKTARILKVAALEKDVDSDLIDQALAALARRDVPIALIWGAHDQISNEPEQIEPLRHRIPVRYEKRLEDAGHAIPWTHAEALAQATREFISQIQRSLK